MNAPSVVANDVQVDAEALRAELRSWQQQRAAAIAARDRIAAQLEQADGVLSEIEGKLRAFDAVDEQLIEQRADTVSEALRQGRPIPVTAASAEGVQRIIERSGLEHHQRAVLIARGRLDGEHQVACQTVQGVEAKVDELVARIIVEEATDVAADLIDAEDRAYALRLRLNAIGALRNGDNRFFALPEAARELLIGGPIFASKWNGLSPQETAFWRARIAALKRDVDGE